MPETKTNDAPRQRLEDDPMSVRDEDLEARHEPFDSYWQGPADLEKGYGSFGVYYRYNVMPYIPKDKSASILVVSCGPGYLVKLLKDDGYEHVIGIDSDPEKVAHGQKRGLDCRAEKAFGFIKRYENEFDVVVCEQELNHLTQAESIAFLRLCHRAMRPGATLFAYGLNGANPIVGAENLAHNIDHFSTYAEHSIKQVIELSGFRDVKPMPLKLYVFWKNPLNYVGLAVTGTLELWYRVIFKMYGKNCKIFSKKIAAVAKK
ncbi:MAG: class I SAM-dependent methyltransferase [Planctomycetota bacterium]